jgi:hypothetical protein
MPRGIPIPYEQLPKTQTNLGQFQRAEGLRGLNTDAGAAIESAGRHTTIDPRGFAVAASAVGDIGRAVAGQGGAMMELQIKQNEAINIRKEHEAVLAMELEQSAISADIANEPDETKWEGIASGRMKSLNQQLFSSPLSPAAKEAITQRFGDWEKRQTVTTKINSAERSHAKAGDSIHANMIRAVDEGRFDDARELGRQGHAAGYLSESQLAQKEVEMRARAEQNARKAQAEGFEQGQNSAIAVTSGSGVEIALKDLDGGKFGAFDATQKERIRNVIQGVGRDRSMEDASKLADAIAAPDGIRTPEQVDAFESRHLTPALRQEFKDGLLKRQDAAERERLAQPDVQYSIYGKLLAATDRWNKHGPGAEREYFDILNAAGQLPERLRGEITGPLYAKRQEKEVSPDELSLGYLNNRMSRFYERGSFGKFRVPGPVDLKTGKPTEVIDPQKEDAAALSRAKVTRSLMGYLKKNPDATEDEIDRVMGQAMAGHLDKNQAAEMLGEMKSENPSGLIPPPPPGTYDIPDGVENVTSGKVTKFGYTMDPNADKLSAKRIAAFSGKKGEDAANAGKDHPNLLKRGDLAVSPDIEEEFTAAGVKPGDFVKVKLKNGKTRTVRWMDRTATDEQAKALGLPPLRGRWDFYTPDGKEPDDGSQVVSFVPVKSPKA